MKTLKAKIIGSLLIMLTMVLLVIISDLGSYSVSQEYSKTAADQLNDYTDAYKIQRTQSGINRTFMTIQWIIGIILVGAIVMIWTPKKAKKKVNKKMKKAYK